LKERAALCRCAPCACRAPTRYATPPLACFHAILLTLSAAFSDGIDAAADYFHFITSFRHFSPDFHAAFGHAAIDYFSLIIFISLRHFHYFSISFS
jgi:hypothetical protein